MTEFRDRSRTTYHGGTYTVYNGTELRNQPQRQIRIESCSDVVGRYPFPNALRIIKTSKDGRLNGSDSNGNKCTDYLLENISTPSSGWGGIPQIDLEALATQAMASTNPSRPEVRVPVFFSELRDLPRLVQLAGRSITQKAASANLSWQFGWKPLIGDLTSMLNFEQSVDKRMIELKRLQSSTGLKRRWTFSAESGSVTTGTTTLNSFQAIVRADYQDIPERQCWATLTWRVNQSYVFPVSDAATRSLAWRLVTGMHYGQQIGNLWEAMPWSWLIDWFGNIGDFIEASDNSIACVPESFCIMNNSKLTRSHSITEISEGFSVSGLKAVKEYKYRDTVSPTASITASFPALSGRQLSILGSLAILRSR